MADLFSLRGKVVILTGGLGLIGLNYAKALIGRGARVAVLDLADSLKARKILKNKTFLYYQSDITSRNSLLAVRRKVLKRFGKIDVLINNAAWDPKVGNSKKGPPQSNFGSFENLPLASWNKELGINLTGTMLCCQIFGAKMKRGSSIINISSTYGLVAPDQSIYPKGFIKPATYGVSKGAVISLTQYLAAYWGKKGIRVNAVVPGGVYSGQDQEFVRKYSSKTPLGRMANPDEYNGIIIYLASDASSYATGAVFTVDGGWTAW